MNVEPAEMSVRELRADLADVINAANTRGQVTFVTSRGRRVAGVVSVAAAEQAAGPDGQADDDAGLAVILAVNLAMMLDRGGTPDLTPAECFEQYAGDLVRELGGSAERALAAARAVIAESVGKAGYPALWRQAALAVELCQRAAENTGPELPGSYRPGNQAGGAARRRPTAAPS
jgi:prevent-host-death family protein